ncbi:MAG: hypothetical protein QF408_14705 [Pirellulales bacterium]|nr:hypothetical protein [Pirellulales bacterium]HJN67444.1 hypothetical protein [Pirellulales bacterium]
MGKEDKKTTKKTGMGNPEGQRKYWEYLKAQYNKRGGMPIDTPLYRALQKLAEIRRCERKRRDSEL